MAATLESINLLGTVEYTESSGIPQSIGVEAIVTGFSQASVQAAITEILATSGLPAVGSSITIGSKEVVLEERSVTIEDVSRARVSLTYKRQDVVVIGGGGDLFDFDLRGGVSLEQVKSELDFQATPQPFQVEHNEIKQGGAIEYERPVPSLTLTMVEQTATPWLISTGWCGYVNSHIWLGALPRTYLITSVQWEPVDLTASPPKVRFTYEFHYKQEGHDTAIMFIDRETGEPPEGLVEGDPQPYGLPPGAALGGFRTVETKPARNFSEKF